MNYIYKDGPDAQYIHTLKRREMAQWIKSFTIKPKGLSLIPETHIMERKINSYKLSSNTSDVVCMGVYVHTHNGIKSFEKEGCTLMTEIVLRQPLTVYLSSLCWNQAGLKLVRN